MFFLPLYYRAKRAIRCASTEARFSQPKHQEGGSHLFAQLGKKKFEPPPPEPCSRSGNKVEDKNGLQFLEVLQQCHIQKKNRPAVDGLPPRRVAQASVRSARAHSTAWTWHCCFQVARSLLWKKMFHLITCVGSAGVSARSNIFIELRGLVLQFASRTDFVLSLFGFVLPYGDCSTSLY